VSQGAQTAAFAVGLISCGETDRAQESGHATVVFKEEIAEQLHPDYSRPYAFSDDRFTPKIQLWQRVFASLAGKPDRHHLEIGVYEAEFRSGRKPWPERRPE
jgi:hypothetical protein